MYKTYAVDFMIPIDIPIELCIVCHVSVFQQYLRIYVYVTIYVYKSIELFFIRSLEQVSYNYYAIVIWTSFSWLLFTIAGLLKSCYLEIIDYLFHDVINA